MNRAELESLRDRLAKATAPDRRLDADIAVAFRIGSEKVDEDHWSYRNFPTWIGRDDGCVEAGMHWPSPAFTAGIDAAVTLVPPDTDWALEVHSSEGIAATLYVGGYDDGIKACEFGSTPALALCLARIEYELAKVPA